jgi:DNA polymerase-1
LPHYAYSRQATAIDTLLTNFIRPLQEQVDANSRVHCSLNLNTETGRLSARRPNLQNQPALEKDRYKAYVSELEQWPIYRC